MSFRRLVRLFAAALAVASLSACSVLGRAAFATPTVELRDVRIRGLGLDGGSLDLVLDVYNPNAYRLDATRLTYTLVADTETVATGAITRRVTLVNKTHNDVTLPVTFNFRELLNAADVMLHKGAVDYTVKGEVTVDSPFGSVTRPYVGKARIDNATLIRP